MSAPLTAEQIAQLRGLAEKATRTPWRWDEHRVPTLYGRAGEPGVYEWDTEVMEADHRGECGCRSACELNLEVSPEDRALIAAAVNALPALLDAAERVAALEADGSGFAGLRQAERYLRQHEQQWPADAVAAAVHDLGAHVETYGRLEGEIEALEAERDALTAALQRVRELHESIPVRLGAYCRVCGTWPCPTIRAIEGDDRG